MRKLSFILGGALLVSAAILTSCTSEENPVVRENLDSKIEAAIANEDAKAIEIVLQYNEVATIDKKIEDPQGRPIVIRGLFENAPATVVLGEDVIIEAANNVTLQNVIIDASATGKALVELKGVTTAAKNVDGTENTNYKYVENITIKNVEVKGLSKALVQDQAKTLVENIIVDNSIVQFVAPGGINVFNFNGKGYPANLVVKNSTIYSIGNEDGEKYHTGYFLQCSGRVRDLDKDQTTFKQKVTIENSTLYTIAYGKQMNNMNGKGQKSLEFTLKNSILVDCNINDGNNEIRGWLGGQNSTNPTVVYENNTYWCDGELQAGWTNSSKQGYDASETQLVTDPDFVDAEGGDFTVRGAEQKAKKTGDPRWLK